MYCIELRKSEMTPEQVELFSWKEKEKELWEMTIEEKVIFFASKCYPQTNSAKQYHSTIRSRKLRRKRTLETPSSRKEIMVG
jgi:hypothetical protein